ncbi:MAG: hypothetical protein V9G18_20345, partial [Albidovulum sp.]
MQKSKLWLAPIAIGAIGLLAPPSPARADCDGCVVAAVNAHKEEMIRQFTLLKNLLLEQFKTVRQSIAQVEKDSLRARADLAFRPPARACETATAGGAAGPARDRAEAYHRALNHLRRAELTGAAAGEAMVKTQVERYCSAEDAGSRGCAQASGRPDAQFQTETLYSGSGLGAGADPTRPNTFLPEVLSFDDDRIADARRLIDNAADPYPTDDLPKALRETPQGKTFWIRRKLYEGRLSASRYSLNHALALRMPAAGLKAWLLQIWQESRATEHKNELIAALPANISYLETLKAAVDSRFAMPSWYAGVAGNNADANLRELAYMQALGLNFQYLLLRQGERIEGLLARANIGDAHQNERVALREERAAAINLVKPTT